MSFNQLQSDIEYLTDSLSSPVDRRVMLRPSLEAALFRMGYEAEAIDLALDRYYNGLRTIH